MNIWTFLGEWKELIVAGIAWLAYTFRDNLLPAWMNTQREAREAQATLTDRLFQVLDRQVHSMDETGKLIRDVSILLPTIAQSLSNASSTMYGRHELTHSILRDMLSRLDLSQASHDDIKDCLVEIRQVLQMPTQVTRKRAARARPAAFLEKDDENTG
jgi:hypothetical protein